ncbi:hypothetical protein BOTBODRAFT_587352 [Botryobasidium botryosum FD-172 SS1]|uniref:RNase III domain-containing protein n=1 Tax=Botryobasidium botryosum (strain FD-172 SS1) TaxID=930990 RepID=A0A067M7Y0_BOTB1|nr:hypothetical protein BOTBODRAFT_587352 [Botryobasidium botryosum FD-172 SS1]
MALLRYHAVNYLIEEYGRIYDPGTLTRMKNSIASIPATAALCVEQSLDQFLTTKANSRAQAEIQGYVPWVLAAKEAEMQEALGKEQPRGQHWLHIPPSKTLAMLVGRLFFATALAEEFEVGKELFQKLCVPFFLTYARTETSVLQAEDSLRNRFGDCKQFAITILGEADGEVCMEATYHGVTLATASGRTPHLAARRCCPMALAKLKTFDYLVLCKCYLGVGKIGPQKRIR